jgi:hypothetical protein
MFFLPLKIMNDCSSSDANTMTSHIQILSVESYSSGSATGHIQYTNSQF